MTIAAALSGIVTVVSNVSGFRSVPLNPPETVNVWPVAISYVMDGQADASPIGTRKHLLNLAVEVFTARKDLARDLEIVGAFLDSLPAALLAEVSGSGALFGNTISTFDNVKYELLEKVYAGVDVIGYRFTMQNVKIIV